MAPLIDRRCSPATGDLPPPHDARHYHSGTDSVTCGVAATRGGVGWLAGCFEACPEQDPEPSQGDRPRDGAGGRGRTRRGAAGRPSGERPHEARKGFVAAGPRGDPQEADRGRRRPARARRGDRRAAEAREQARRQAPREGCDGFRVPDGVNLRRGLRSRRRAGAASAGIAGPAACRAGGGGRRHRGRGRHGSLGGRDSLGGEQGGRAVARGRISERAGVQGERAGTLCGAAAAARVAD